MISASEGIAPQSVKGVVRCCPAPQMPSASQLLSGPLGSCSWQVADPRGAQSSMPVAGVRSALCLSSLGLGDKEHSFPDFQASAASSCLLSLPLQSRAPARQVASLTGSWAPPARWPQTSHSLLAPARLPSSAPSVLTSPLWPLCRVMSLETSLYSCFNGIRGRSTSLLALSPSSL